jgi:hypothetical protein
MSVRIALAFGASLCLVACGNADAAASKGHGAAAASASINWSDATLNAAKVDYVFNAMNKMTDYAAPIPTSTWMRSRWTAAGPRPIMPSA